MNKLVKIAAGLVLFVSSISSAFAVGGTIAVTSSASSGDYGDLVTYTVKLNTSDIISYNALGLGLHWDEDVFALDATSTAGVAGDNDPHRTAYLDGQFGNEQNDDNSRLTIVTANSADTFEIRDSDSDGSGDPLNGTSGRAYVYNTRGAYNAGGAVITDYTLFTVTLRVKDTATVGSSSVTAFVKAVSDLLGSVPGDYTGESSAC